MEYKRGGLQKERYEKDEVALRSCPLCADREYSPIFTERGSLGIVRCKKCSLIYTNPMIREVNKNYWGDENEYFEEARLIFLGKAGHHRDHNYLKDLGRIEKLKPEGNFLDIGTNMGSFLRHTRNKRWKVTGVEPSPVLSGMARKYYGLNIKTGYIEDLDLEEKSFDVVTLIDVFEHIAKPKEMLSFISRLMKDNGILFIKVPNARYSLLKLRLSKLTGKLAEYDIFDSYEHLTHYTQETLKRMLYESGFKIKKTFIGEPVQVPAWHKYVGRYYQYPSPWTLDKKNYALRVIFHWASKIEFLLRFGGIGYFASNIIVIAEKN
ncbi:MAG: class I SAM-dependent methyltransferase [Candidatus Omnitrophica bacterium]|nr:class I SAM-dependent methyltransferase [Candidatus Omnitrophota bacterium]MDD5553535.1 class I SAM-dependent methyltransferase [Candidatus Omnitrophota bacterium]